MYVEIPVFVEVKLPTRRGGLRPSLTKDMERKTFCVVVVVQNSMTDTEPNDPYERS